MKCTKPLAAALLCAVCLSGQAAIFNPEWMLNSWKRNDGFGILDVVQPAKSARPITAAPAGTLGPELEKDAKALLEDGPVFALLLFRDGKLLYEGYAHDADRNTKQRSLSMAKSFTAFAVGEALCAGKLKSLDAKAGSVDRSLGDTAYAKASIRNLLKMASGAQDPGGDGFSGFHDSGDLARLAKREITTLEMIQQYGKVEDKEGERWVYNGLNSEALSHVVATSTGMPMHRWFEQTVWQKAGGESTLGWLKDKSGASLGEMGTLATARDFARLGLYLLDRLDSASPDKCMADYLREATRPQMTTSWPPGHYGYGMHIDGAGNVWLMGAGGQRIVANPSSRTLLVLHGYEDDSSFYESLVSFIAKFNASAGKR